MTGNNNVTMSSRILNTTIKYKTNDFEDYGVPYFDEDNIPCFVRWQNIKYYY